MSHEPEYVLNMETIAEIFGVSPEEARNLHRTGVNCPRCGDFLHNLGEMIKHKHDFDLDDLKNFGKGDIS